MIVSLIKKQSGFTLIEFLLYLSLTVGMLLILSSIGAAVLTSRMKANDLEEIQYNAEFVHEKIRSIVSSAESVVAPLSGVASNSLTLEMSDTAKNPTVIDVYEGSIRIKEGANESVLLTNNVVSVTDVLFTHTAHEGSVPPVIGIEMSIGPAHHSGYSVEDALFNYSAHIRLGTLSCFIVVEYQYHHTCDCNLRFQCILVFRQ